MQNTTVITSHNYLNKSFLDMINKKVVILQFTIVVTYCSSPSKIELFQYTCIL